ncbi:MAG: hypothetical protein GY787_08750 [Alteromonadales bacterium]|nr:hypothetical protein [Alteromonadales bacterium]
MSKHGFFQKSRLRFYNDNLEATLHKTDEEYHHIIKEDFDGNYNLVGTVADVYLVLKEGMLIGQLTNPKEYRDGRQIRQNLRELSKYSMWYASDNGFKIHRDYGFYVGRKR